MGRRLKETVILEHPKTGVATALLAGKECPSWAEDLITNEEVFADAKPSTGDQGNDGDQVLVGLAEEEYLTYSAKALAAEVKRRNEDREEADQIDVGSRPSKPVLAAALVADDENQDDESDDDSEDDDSDEDDDSEE